MTITIKVDTPPEAMNQRQLQSTRRVANVLRENGFEVELVFAPDLVIKKTA